MLENTWIIIGSDHGDYTGEKGLFNKTESLHECLLHVPLIIAPPAGQSLEGPDRIDHLVSTVDLFPTILGLAGFEAPEYCQGRDLLPWVRAGADTPLHEAVYAQVGDYHGFCKTTFPTGIPESGRHPSLLQAARTASWAYIRDPDYGDEAYDLGADPHELRNLLGAGSGPPRGEVGDLKERVNRFEGACLSLREHLGLCPAIEDSFRAGNEHSPH